MTPEQIVAFALALASPAPAEPLFPVIAAGGADPRYPVAAAPCPTALAPLEVEGLTVSCGRVDVPENHDRPDGRRIALSFMILKSPSQAPAPDAVVYLHGGPGSGVVSHPVLISRFLNDIRSRRHVVAFDQRGVATSAGPDSLCYVAIAADAEAAAQAARGEGDPAAVGRHGIRACLDEIAANGADISTVNTLQNARDVRAAMSALGFPAYNIFGTSYGTKLGQEVMRSAPEGLRSVILDSVWPVQVPFYDNMGLPIAESIQSVFDQCAADPACAAAYPDLKARYWTLWEKLDAAPLETPQVKVAGMDLNLLLMRRNSFGPGNQGVTGYLPKMIADLERGDATLYFDLSARRLPAATAPEAALAGIEADRRGLAEAALRLAAIGRETEAAAGPVLAAIEGSRRAAAAGTAQADVFDSVLLAAARELHDHPARLAFASDYLLLRAGAHDGAALTAMLRRHFRGPTLGRLEALVMVMTPAQITQVFARIGADNAGIDAVLVGQFQLQMFACQEDMEINGPVTIPAASETLRSRFGWPEKLTEQLESSMIKMFYAPCEEFRRHPRPGMNDPVTAEVPTLVLQGMVDTQTAAGWGPLLASTLPRSQLAVFPETGHGAFIFSQCARDIAAAFIDNPGGRVDVSCASAFTPAFLLPDGGWSRPAR